MWKREVVIYAVLAKGGSGNNLEMLHPERLKLRPVHRAAIGFLSPQTGDREGIGNDPVL